MKNLGQLPDTLENTYAMLYQKIEDKKGRTPEIVKGALMWLMFSAIPLTMQNWVEVVGWTAQMDSPEGLNDQVLNSVQLLELCRYLVFFDQESGIVRFAHLSVREFLETKFATSDAHFMIAESCAAHLNRTVRADRSEKKPVFKSIFETKDPNQPPISYYSHFFWAKHARACRGNRREWYHVSKFLRDSYRFWLDTVSHKTREEGSPIAISHPVKWVLSKVQSDPPNPLFILPYIHLDVSILGSLSPELHVHNSFGKSLLYVASLYGHTEIVRRLLDGKLGAQCYLCVEPLVEAVERRQWEVAKILKNHIISHWHTESLAIILFRTGWRRYDSVTQKVSKFMDLEVTEAVLVSALTNSRSKTELMKDLLEKADTTAVTPVVIAAMVGNRTRTSPIPWGTAMLEDLLQKNPSINITADVLVKSLGTFGISANQSSSPAIVGIKNEDIIGINDFSTAVTEILLSRIEPNNIEPACLNVAAYFGELKLFNRLLAKGVPFPSAQEELSALLIAATQGQNECIVQKVAEHAGWIHDRDEHGWTPCHIAKLCGQERLIVGKCSEPHLTHPLVPSEWAEFSNSLKVSGLELYYEGMFFTQPPGKTKGESTDYW